MTPAVHAYSHACITGVGIGGVLMSTNVLTLCLWASYKVCYIPHYLLQCSSGMEQRTRGRRCRE